MNEMTVTHASTLFIYQNCLHTVQNMHRHSEFELPLPRANNSAYDRHYKDRVDREHHIAYITNTMWPLAISCERPRSSPNIDRLVFDTNDI